MAEFQPFSMYSPPSAPCAHRLLLLGEAPGEEEERQGRPFVGPSGKLLDELLALAGLRREHFHLLNVFSERPPGNDLKLWTLTKTELKKQGFEELGRLPQLNKRYLHPQHEPHLQRLKTELAALQPELILCLGGTALWALSSDSRITQSRGSFFSYTQKWAPTSGTEWRIRTDWGKLPSPRDFSCKALATFHPAAVIREWSLRPIVWADLRKVRQWLDGSLPAPIKRKLWINPTFEEIAHVYSTFSRVPTDLLGVDIETAPRAGQITTFAIGTAEECICIPLWDKNTLPGLCHRYARASEEALAWQWVRRFCALPNPKVLQNGLYDMQWLLDVMDIRLENVLHDTSILQHALQPELPKDLGTLGSLYLNEPAWKFMRQGKAEEAKADE